MDLFEGALFEDVRRATNADAQLFFESVDGRGQETIRQGFRRPKAFVDRLGEILLEVGQQESADGFGNERGHGGIFDCLFIDVDDDDDNDDDDVLWRDCFRRTKNRNDI